MAKDPLTDSLAEDLPPYEPQRIIDASFPERIRLACTTWADSSPNRPSVMALYWGKYFIGLIGIWAFWCSFNVGYPGFLQFGEWAFTAEAFKKAIVWSMTWELLGFGCGWGPMNARFDKFFGGYRHFARPGTIKLPLFRGAPLIGGDTRNYIDVIAYVLAQLSLFRVLFAPEVTPALLLPCFVLVALNGVLDKTLFLAARYEHYWVVMGAMIFAAANDLWIAGAMLTWSFIWIWAAVSKWNGHFPSVIMFMMNNGPFFPKVLKKRLFRNFPDDLRPSAMAKKIAIFGHISEIAIPFILLAAALTGSTELLLAGCILLTGFHGFIGLNNPNGMPVEWNILMIYGGWFLFWFHPEMSVLDMSGMPLLLAVMLFSLAVVPAYGNLVPSRVSFLPSMRYYAGNWAYNVWLFRKNGSVEKLKKLKKVGGTVNDQLADLLEDPKEFEVAKVMMGVSRFMHFEGRPLFEALPVAVDQIDEYEWYEGEVLGGTILGWNFGDGHLNGHQLVRAIQPLCEFEEGELRVISVEGQPLFGETMHWTVYDAASGEVANGETQMSDYEEHQPWPVGDVAKALE
ncbi:MAG: DUF3556 domain-containing protein [Candidatus Binatia bacterium]|nr:DUF3556 domain-containing protein [Candidatus Binatia bacterium]MDG2008870.1 DUF3556 domain-containing protein [Candidatus Binatia bacterium]